MEILVVTSKIKKYIKEQANLSTSSNFAEELSKFVAKTCDEAIENTKNAGRKTVMGKDFIFNDENAQVTDVLVVASKVKKYIKEKADFNTSANCAEQLTLAVQDLCKKAIQNAIDQKRKTVMDRDLQGLY
ncbi:MAG: hypothetical protein KBD63_02915 [Bacteriovoracaceae bacterium]|nr:hypothetical protein [Bacteriovoracaceae bacterium]